MNEFGLARYDPRVVIDEVPLVSCMIIYSETIYCQAAIRDTDSDKIDTPNLCFHSGLHALNPRQIRG